MIRVVTYLQFYIHIIFLFSFPNEYNSHCVHQNTLHRAVSLQQHGFLVFLKSYLGLPKHKLYCCLPLIMASASRKWTTFDLRLIVTDILLLLWSFDFSSSFTLNQGSFTVNTFRVAARLILAAIYTQNSVEFDCCWDLIDLLWPKRHITPDDVSGTTARSCYRYWLQSRLFIARVAYHNYSV